jgi:hypothetical protein
MAESVGSTGQQGFPNFVADQSGVYDVQPHGAYLTEGDLSQMSGASRSERSPHTSSHLGGSDGGEEVQQQVSSGIAGMGARADVGQELEQMAPPPNVPPPDIVWDAAGHNDQYVVGHANGVYYVVDTLTNQVVFTSRNHRDAAYHALAMNGHGIQRRY